MKLYTQIQLNNKNMINKFVRREERDREKKYNWKKWRTLVHCFI